MDPEDEALSRMGKIRRREQVPRDGCDSTGRPDVRIYRRIRRVLPCSVGLCGHLDTAVDGSADGSRLPRPMARDSTIRVSPSCRCLCSDRIRRVVHSTVSHRRDHAIRARARIPPEKGPGETAHTVQGKTQGHLRKPREGMPFDRSRPKARADRMGRQRGRDRGPR